MAKPPPLKDQYFNAQTMAQLAGEISAGVPSFDAERFQAEALAGFPERELMARLEWMADCHAAQLPTDFPTMADHLVAGMRSPLDPMKTDDDFGHFMHATPAILAVRHGLEDHRDRAMALLYDATQRFSVEFYIRAFINRWTDETLETLRLWARDENYHVRRLVSEGTRPRLPWAQNVTLTPEQTFPLLDMLYADPTRYVTRSVANHLNDLSKIVPDAVIDRLARWEAEGRQDASELSWMRRHALRTLVKKGHAGALAALGYRADAPVTARMNLHNDAVAMGERLSFDVVLESEFDAPVMVDYRVTFARAGGKQADKVFKLKATQLRAGVPLKVSKAHAFKGDATTFNLFAGAHAITVQINGRDVARADFTLTD